MSRQEIAEAVNAWIWEHQKRRTHLDGAYIGKLERGEVRWPLAHVRAGLRGVFGADDDASIGLYVVYGAGRSTDDGQPLVRQASEAVPPPAPLIRSDGVADTVPTVRLGVPAGAAVAITLESGSAGPIRVVLTTMPADSHHPAPLPSSGTEARVYSLPVRRRRA
ncbi:hypothetical protein O7630_03135 [Micromonospora sp. WMMD718]|uniref:hypothetical protein n=1 Tax=Micromonospora sp. WMMD718 TaxID=3016098 RepID=UPI0024179549|nr:hypothetical protein [Micromonospora sp. WMMD718]MDG4749927.1 hypothetical protein [Micromonospora sp. WMMD718]